MTNEVYWKPEPVHIKKIATILKDILVQVWVTFVPRDGVYIYEVDPSNTATLVYKNQESFSYEGDVPLVFCLFTSQLHKALKRAKKTSEVVITTTNMDHVLKIRYDTFRFDATSLPDIRPVYDLPVLTNDIKFTREVKDLYETIHAISGISTKLHLGIVNDTLTWRTIRDEGGLILSIQEVEPGLVANFQGKFLLKYLYKVLKTNISKDVVVQIDTTKRVISFQFDQWFTLIMALALQ
jgi:hypothetical protein